MLALPLCQSYSAPAVLFVISTALPPEPSLCSQTDPKTLWGKLLMWMGWLVLPVASGHQSYPLFGGAGGAG